MQVEATSEQSHHDSVSSSDRLIGLLDPLSFRAAPNTEKGVKRRGRHNCLCSGHAYTQFVCSASSLQICHHLMEGWKSKETEKAELGFSPKPESTTNLLLTTDCSRTSNLCQCQGKKGWAGLSLFHQ